MNFMQISMKNDIISLCIYYIWDVCVCILTLKVENIYNGDDDGKITQWYDRINY